MLKCLGFVFFLFIMPCLGFASFNDKDKDQIEDSWELDHELNPNNTSDSNIDPDGDGLLNYEEYFVNHDPHVYDPDLTDSELLELSARKAFLYFWEESKVPSVAGYTQPVLIPDHSSYNGGGAANYYSIADVGFALTSFIVADQRGWADHIELYHRSLATLKFFRELQISNNPNKVKHGYLYHYYYLDGIQGKSEVSSIDHALFIAGALAAGQWFHGTEVESLANQLYFSTEWNWMWDSEKGFIRMAWHDPENKPGPVEGGSWGEDHWDRYSELMILVALAVGPNNSPYKVPSFTWKNIKRPLVQYGTWPNTDIPLPSHINAGSLHNHQYAHMFLDLKDRPDNLGYDYFSNSRIATLVNRQYCMDLNLSDPLKYDTYDKNIWGLAACNASLGYGVLQAIFLDDPNYSPETIEAANDSGTLAPFAPLGSIPFAPAESVSALRHMYENRNSLLNNQSIWGRYGFLNCFNTGVAMNGLSPYYNSKVIGIDLGPIVGMTENYRSGLLWKYVLRSWIVKTGMENMGFNVGLVAPFKLDFESGKDANSFGGSSGGIGEGSIKYSTETPNGSNASVAISGNEAGDGAWIGLNGHSIHYWDGFKFWMKGQVGIEAIEVGLKDTAGHEYKISMDSYLPEGDLAAEWIEVKIPLEPFIENGVFLTSVDNISFVFTSQGGDILVDDVQFIEDAFAPSAPINLKARYFYGTQSIQLSWDESPQSDVVGYRIYKKVGEGNFEEIKADPNAPYVFVNGTFTDQDVLPSKSYTYQVTAVDNYQNPMDSEYRGLEGKPAEDKAFSSDLDKDGLDDEEEVELGTSPTDPDSDDDGFKDGKEVYDYKTNPLNPDTDGDGATDKQEVDANSEPTDSDSQPTHILLTAKHSYTLYVNGKKIGKGSGVTTPEKFFVDLKPGGTLAVQIKNSKKGNSLLACNVVYQGKEIVSNFIWRVSTKPRAGWQKPGYDHTSWPSATEYYPLNESPWGSFSEFDPNTKWIGSHSTKKKKAWFWSTFNPELNGVIKISTDAQCFAYINGKYLAGVDDWKKVRFVPAKFEPGDILAIRALRKKKKGGLIAEVDMIDVHGNRQYFVTGPDWKTQKGGGQEGWELSQYDDSKWSNASVIKKLGRKPWKKKGTLKRLYKSSRWIWHKKSKKKYSKEVLIRKVIPNAIFYATADQKFDAYLNGQYLGSNDELNKPLAIGLYVKGGDVIGVNAQDVDGLAGFLGQIVFLREWTEVLTNSTWKVSDFVPDATSWSTQSYDASIWSNAFSMGTNGIPQWNKIHEINENAEWIWGSHPKQAYFRYVIGSDNGSALTTLQFTTDEAAGLYLNGNLLATTSNWMQAVSMNVNLSPGDNLAVKNMRSGGKGGFILKATGAKSFISEKKGWRYNTKEELGWNQKGFLAEGWGNPINLGLYGMAPWYKNVKNFNGHDAYWIWGETAHPEVYMTRLISGLSAKIIHAASNNIQAVPSSIRLDTKNAKLTNSSQALEVSFAGSYDGNQRIYVYTANENKKPGLIGLTDNSIVVPVLFYVSPEPPKGEVGIEGEIVGGYDFKGNEIKIKDVNSSEVYDKGKIAYDIKEFSGTIQSEPNTVSINNGKLYIYFAADYSKAKPQDYASKIYLDMVTYD